MDLHNVKLLPLSSAQPELKEPHFLVQNLQTPALRSIGNIVSGSDIQTQLAIDAGVLSTLPQLMRHPKASMQKEAAWALSNIAAGPCKQIQQIITCGLLPPLVELLKNVSR